MLQLSRDVFPGIVTTLEAQICSFPSDVSLEEPFSSFIRCPSAREIACSSDRSRNLQNLVIHFTLVMRTDMSGREPALVPVDLAGDSG